jgi:hypothetical protein
MPGRGTAAHTGSDIGLAGDGVGRPDFEQAGIRASVASGVGRIWSRSAEIGLATRSSGGAPPNISASARGTKLKVTHSASPRPASRRRAFATCTCA